MDQLAPVKAQYLCNAPIGKEAATAYGGDAASRGVVPQRTRARGEGKKSSDDSIASPRLCGYARRGQSCTLGDRCHHSHDVALFLSRKPADLSSFDRCPVFEATGRCGSGFACRFGQSHIKWAAGKDEDPILLGLPTAVMKNQDVAVGKTDTGNTAMNTTLGPLGGRGGVSSPFVENAYPDDLNNFATVIGVHQACLCCAYPYTQCGAVYANRVRI